MPEDDTRMTFDEEASAPFHQNVWHMADEGRKWRGAIEIKGWRHNGQTGLRIPGPHLLAQFPNIITNDGLDIMAAALRDPTGVNDPEIAYVALGDDNTAPAVTDSALVSEQFRKQVTSQVAGATGVSITTLYVAPFEGNFQIEEIGWFAGDASGVADSGTLIARVLWSHLKDNLESLQIDRTDTIS